MAATFANRDTRVAVRVTAREEAKELAVCYPSPGADRREAQRRAYGVMPEGELPLSSVIRRGTGFGTRRHLICPIARAPVTVDFVERGDADPGRPVEVAWYPAWSDGREIACGQACARPDAFRPAA